MLHNLGTLREAYPFEELLAARWPSQNRRSHHVVAEWSYQPWHLVFLWNLTSLLKRNVVLSHALSQHWLSLSHNASRVDSDAPMPTPISEPRCCIFSSSCFDLQILAFGLQHGPRNHDGSEGFFTPELVSSHFTRFQVEIRCVSTPLVKPSAAAVERCDGKRVHEVLH